MKQKLFSASIVLFLALPASAQLSTDSLRQNTIEAGKSDLSYKLLTLAGALKPESYKALYAKEKNRFFDRVKSAKDGNSLANSIAEFATYIKPEKFRKGFNLEELTRKIKSGTSLRKSAENLINLENEIKPDAISSMWNLTRESWKKELKQLQQSAK